MKPISLESEAGFRVLFECATIGILVINERGIIELSNPCAGRLFGYEPEELAGKPIEVLVPESLRRQHIHHRESYFEKPKARPMGLGMELFACKKGGEVFPVEISLGHYTLGCENLAVAFVTDITEQVNARKIVADKEAWFRNMADNSPVMIWVAGADKRCTYFNNTWLMYTGRTLDLELGHGWIDGVHPDDVEACRASCDKAFATEQPFSMEYRLRRHDGQYRWIRDSGKPTYDSEGQFTGFIGSCTEIHEQRIMKEELEFQVTLRTAELHDALTREKEMNELKSRFVSMASHEFRTPLSIVLSSTMLIEQYTNKEDHKVDKHLHKIKSAVNNLTAILNDFLSLDRLEQGTIELETEVFDIANFMREVMEEAQVLRKSGQFIDFKHAGDPMVLLDQKKLRYIMTNLVSNAFKYSSTDGAVKLHTENNGNSLKIVVKDDGIGIPEPEQENLFKKFFRAKNTGSIPGTGLGITIVKRYVELMNGNISFISRENEGTTFTIEFSQSL